VLTITFTDDNLGPSQGGLTTSVGGTLSGSTLTINAFSSVGTYSSLTFNTTPFSGSVFDPIDLPAGSTLGLKAVITADGAGQQSFDASASVPDGGLTVAFLGFVLVGLEGLRRRLTK
jgi:hypothetical protein